MSIRKDIDTGIFEFPEPVELRKRLKDLLEDTVDEKYYVNPERVKALTPQLIEKQVSNAVRGGERFNRPSPVGLSSSTEVVKVGDTGEHQKDGVYDPGGISTTLLSSHYKQPIQIIEGQNKVNEDIGIIFLGNIYPTKNRVNPNQGRVYHPDGLAPTLNCKGGVTWNRSF